MYVYILLSFFLVLLQLRVDDILLRGLKWSKLLDPNKKGQWWLAGDVASTAENIEEVAGKIDKELPETKKMLQLAASMRMNTSARNAIFCVIMSGEDYLDAFEKLIALDLQGKQVSISYYCSLAVSLIVLIVAVAQSFLLHTRIERSCAYLWSAVYKRKYSTSITAFLQRSYAAMTKTTSSHYR